MSDQDVTADLSPRLREDVLDFLATRRSTPSKTLIAPGPTEAQIERFMTMAARVPDHGKLTPWRFIAFSQAARERVAKAALARAEALGREDGEKAHRQLLEAPVMVAVVASPVESPKIPALEQILSAGAVCLGMVNAGLASGFGAQWLSGWIAHDEAFLQTELGLKSGERLAGFIHYGTPKNAPMERPRPDVTALVTTLD